MFNFYHDYIRPSDKKRWTWPIYCCYHFLILDWEVTKHATIGVFEAKWTIGVGLANQFISFV